MSTAPWWVISYNVNKIFCFFLYFDLFFTDSSGSPYVWSVQVTARDSPSSPVMTVAGESRNPSPRLPVLSNILQALQSLCSLVTVLIRSAVLRCAFCTCMWTRICIFLSLFMVMPVIGAVLRLWSQWCMGVHCATVQRIRMLCNWIRDLGHSQII